MEKEKLLSREDALIIERALVLLSGAQSVEEFKSRLVECAMRTGKPPVALVIPAMTYNDVRILMLDHGPKAMVIPAEERPCSCDPCLAAVARQANGFYKSTPVDNKDLN